MKAIVQDDYGSPDDVLELREIDMPAVGDDEVLVRVHAASVHPDVWHVVRGPAVRPTPHEGRAGQNQRTVFRERMWQVTSSRLART